MGTERTFQKRLRCDRDLVNQFTSCRSLLGQVSAPSDAIQTIVLNRAIPRALTNDPVLSHLTEFAKSVDFSHNRQNGSNISLTISLSNWMLVRELAEKLWKVSEGDIIEMCLRFALSSRGMVRELYVEGV